MELNTSIAHSYESFWMTTDESNSVVFKVCAAHSAYILLAAQLDNYEGDSYEIVIGAFGNTITWIRKNGTNGDIEVSRPTSGILSGDEHRWFWISWQNGHIQVRLLTNKH